MSCFGSASNGVVSFAAGICVLLKLDGTFMLDGSKTLNGKK
jgi:hypothetical protein